MKVCFISPDAYSLFDEKTSYIFGGAELRAVTLAKALGKFDDLSICFVVKNHFVNKQKKFGQIEVIPHFELRGQGFWESTNTLAFRLKEKVKKKSSPKITPEEFYTAINADVYIAFGFSDMGLEALKFAKSNDKKFVFSFATDDEINSPEKFRDGIFLPMISDCNFLIAQTEFQKEQAFKKFSKQAWLMKNPVSLKYDMPKKEQKFSFDVLWIGKTSKQKAPERFLKLSAIFPEFKFLMIMNISDKKYYSENFVTVPSNLKIIESVPFSEVETYFKACKIFVNTSEVEGFANTFLQAAKYGKPILSYAVDSGELFSKHHCGICAKGDETIFADSFLQLMNNEMLYSEISASTLNYVSKFHNSEFVAEDFYQHALRNAS